MINKCKILENEIYEIYVTKLFRILIYSKYNFNKLTNLITNTCLKVIQKIMFNYFCHQSYL